MTELRIISTLNLIAGSALLGYYHESYYIGAAVLNLGGSILIPLLTLVSKK